VAGALWPDKAEARAGANLRSTLWRLADVGRDLIVATARTVQLGPDVACDLHEFESKARRLLEASLSCGSTDLDLRLLDEDLLPTWSDRWVAVERERVRQLRLHALDALSKRLTDLGQYGQAVEVGLAAVAEEPLRESAHRAVIAAHIADGNCGEALQQFHQFRTLSRRELGLEPSDRLRALVTEVTSRETAG
jgi:DNA-binding SARP family transcriptional activator